LAEHAREVFELLQVHLRPSLRCLLHSRQQTGSKQSTVPYFVPSRTEGCILRSLATPAKPKPSAARIALHGGSAGTGAATTSAGFEPTISKVPVRPGGMPVKPRPRFVMVPPLTVARR